MHRLRLLLSLAAVTVVAALVFAVGCDADTTSPEDAGTRPNIIFILTDDQRAETIEMMPQVEEAFGVSFRQFVVTTPTCCPSRSSFLTGDWVHTTRVYTTDRAGYEAFQRIEPDSLGPWLQEQGYVTGFVGKYFNEYERSDPVPPGWDQFYGRLYGSDRGNGATSFALREFRKVGGRVVENDVVAYPNETSQDAYATRIFGERAKEFIRAATDPAQNQEGKPFALFLWTTGVNVNTVEPRYSDAPLPPWRRPPSFLEQDVRDKPSVIRARTSMNATQHGAVRAKELRQSITIDDVVAEIVGLLDELGLRDHTWGFFSSDNGRLWGEHRLAGKWVAYEESIRVPLRVMLPTGQRMAVDALAANVDVAPTIMALAGNSGRGSFEGRSLLPLIDDPSTRWRSHVLLEYSSWCGFRGDRWKYVRHRNGEEELYDLRRDPFELRNQALGRPSVTGRYRVRLQQSECRLRGL